MKRLTKSGITLLFLLTGLWSVALSSPPGFMMTTEHMKLSIDAAGNIESLKGGKKAVEYIPAGQRAPLLSLFKDGVYARPVSMTPNRSKKTITLKYPNGSVATIGFSEKGSYLRFELLSLAPRNGTEAIVWGPYPTTISRLIGETVGVVRDSLFAIGVQSLRINTIEGIPDDGDNPGGGAYIDPLPSQSLPDALKDKVGQPVAIDVNGEGDMPEYVRLYRGSLAVKKPYGSELRLFARDRRIPRTIGAGKTLQYVTPVESDFTGSAIALFGCPEPEVLNTIEKIELGEGLPHPMIDGVWIKRSRRMGEAYMMYEGKDMDKCIEYARNCNFRLVHIGDIFKSWGHFDLQTGRFPNGAEDIRKLTARAKEHGISLGVHTLTTFTGTNDPYVTPIPSDSLCKTGSSVLARDIGAEDRVIYIKDPQWFQNTGSTHTIKIGKELIAYKSVSNEAPWRLLDCVRGQFKTERSAHKAGTAVDKLANNSYRGFLPDIHLQDAYARRMAEVCNETGIDLMDFDGFEGLEATGHGGYGENKFIDLWYRTLDRDRLVCGSTTAHYYWHIYSYMNWGEPWYSGLRESQINYRIENQRYFERNYMPGMLGWFKLENSYRPEEIEWIQARSTAFDAGYLLRVDENIEKSGFKEVFFEAIREWQKARHAKAFTADQIIRMKDPKNEFHLEKVSDNSWNLYPVAMQIGVEHKYRQVQTGEPVATRFKMDNPFAEQPVQLYITALAGDGNTTASVSGLRIEVNGYQALEIDDPVRAGDKLIVDGEAVFVCDPNWNKIKRLNVNSIPKWTKGENQIEVKSEFSGSQAPVLKIDCKAIGAPERVSAKD